jgi:hypothetical protein
MADQCGPWTLDQLDAFGSIDDLLVSLDSPVYESANTCILESSGSIQGEGDLIVSAIVGAGITGEANIIGVGSLAATATRTKTVQATILGVGNLEVNGAKEKLSGAQIQGTCSLTVNGARQFNFIVELSGVGELTANSNAEFSFRPEFSGISNVSALGGIIINGSGNVQANGSLFSDSYIYGEEWKPVSDETNNWTLVPTESNVWSLIPSGSNQWQSRG